MGNEPLILIGALKGSALSCFCALGVARQPVTVQWLCSITNYAHQAVERGLARLKAYQLADQLKHMGAWFLTKTGQQLALIISGLAENQQLLISKVAENQQLLTANKKNIEEEEEANSANCTPPSSSTEWPHIIRTWYEDEIGPFTEAVSQEIARYVAKYPDRHKWEHAFAMAAQYNKRCLAYVLTCVRNYDSTGQRLKRNLKSHKEKAP